MITRDEYMKDSERLHQAYYLQMAQNAGLGLANLPVPLGRIRDALKTDKNLNNIPLHCWDAYAMRHKEAIGRAAAMSGDSGFSLGNGVCALKALARHLAETAT